MSERQLEWLMIMTGPDEAAERSVSNDGDVRKLSKPGKARIWEMSLLRSFKSLRCFSRRRPKGSAAMRSSAPTLSKFNWRLGVLDLVSSSRFRLTAANLCAKCECAC